MDVHRQVVCFVLKLAEERGLLKGRTVGVDSTTLEVDAAMKSIVRSQWPRHRDTGEDWREYLRRLIGTARRLQGAGELAEGLCFVWRTVRIAFARLPMPTSSPGGQKTIAVPRLALAA